MYDELSLMYDAWAAGALTPAQRIALLAAEVGGPRGRGATPSSRETLAPGARLSKTMSNCRMG